jgi:superfamily II DNA or RNA helicase
MLKLRQYQKKATQWINRQLNQGNNPLLVAPTGTGKTKAGTQVIIDRISLHEKNILLVPQVEIMDEWMKEFSDNDINYGYINDEGVIGRNKDVYVCMFQSLSNMLAALPERFTKSFQNVFIDEAHRSAAQSYQDIFDMFSHCHRAGWTATPYRMDNKPLGQFFDKIYEPIRMTEAIKQGYLCQPLVIIPDEYMGYVPDQLSIENVNKADQRQIVKDKKIIGDMLEIYAEIFAGLPVIVPCSGYEHAKLVAAMYESAGWDVGHLHSKLNKYDRRKIVHDVKTGKVNILCTVGVGVEGMNIPGLYGIIWMRMTESLTIYMQFNGRAMRPCNGKNAFVLVDPVGNSVLHGRPDINRKWKLDVDYDPSEDIEIAPVMRMCPVCGTANSCNNEKCWICGHDFTIDIAENERKKKRKLPKFVDGNLIWLEEPDDYNISNQHNIGNSDKYCDKQNDGNDITITRAQKMEILKRDLTGTKSKTKFREGVKWL